MRFLTSSGGLLTFWRYFFTTSSGVLPAHRKERRKKTKMMNRESWDTSGTRGDVEYCSLCNWTGVKESHPCEPASWWSSCSSGRSLALVWCRFYWQAEGAAQVWAAWSGTRAGQQHSSGSLWSLRHNRKRGNPVKGQTDLLCLVKINDWVVLMWQPLLSILWILPFVCFLILRATI